MSRSTSSSRLPEAMSDSLLASFCKSRYDQCSDESKSAGLIEMPTLARPHAAAFLVRHYAGDVTYLTAGFVEKNRDALPPDLAAARACTHA